MLTTRGAEYSQGLTKFFKINNEFNKGVGIAEKIRKQVASCHFPVSMFAQKQLQLRSLCSFSIMQTEIFGGLSLQP